jgi:hypothetical protein
MVRLSGQPERTEPGVSGQDSAGGLDSWQQRLEIIDDIGVPASLIVVLGPGDGRVQRGKVGRFWCGGRGVGGVSDEERRECLDAVGGAGEAALARTALNSEVPVRVTNVRRRTVSPSSSSPG